MRPKKFNFLFITASLYVLVMAITTNLPMAYIYLVILFGLSLNEFKLGLAAWILTIPISVVFEVQILSYLYSSIIIIAFILKLLTAKFKLYKTNFFLYILPILFLSFFSSLLTNYTTYIHFIIILLQIILISYIIIQEISNDKNSFLVLSNAFIISAVISTIIAFTIKDYSTVRLTLGDNSRHLANIIGIASILLTSLYFFKPKELMLDTNFMIFNKFKWLFLIVYVAGLSATVSRGVMISSLVSIFVLFLLLFSRDLKRLQVKNLLTQSLLIIMAFLLIFSIWTPLMKILNVNLDYLATRFVLFGQEAETLESGTDIRFKVWKAALNGLDGWTILYGKGINSFKELASLHGYHGFYSHSVFIDIIVTSGLIGFSALVILMFKTLKDSFAVKNSVSVMLLTFVLFNYISHGSIIANGFWYVLALGIGLNSSIKKHKLTLP